jgi:hypothetical protein
MLSQLLGSQLLHLKAKRDLTPLHVKRSEGSQLPRSWLSMVHLNAVPENAVDYTTALVRV